jgi:signal transduction histidine kinase
LLAAGAAILLAHSMAAAATEPVQVRTALHGIESGRGTYGAVAASLPDTLPALAATPLPHMGARQPSGDAAAAPDIAWFRIAVPPQAGVAGQPLQLYMPRWQSLGQVAVYADRQLLYRSHGSSVWNGFNHPLWLTVSGADGSRPATVTVRIDHPPASGVALSSAWFGTPDALASAHWWRRWLQTELVALAGATFFVIGLFALGAWVARREPAYALFFATATLFLLRGLHYHAGLEPLPIDDAWFGWMTVASLAWMALTINLFSFRLDHRRHPRVESAMVLLLAVPTVLSLPPLATQQQLMRALPVAYGLMIAALVALTVYAIVAAWRRRSGDALLVACWNTLSIPAAVHDLLLQQHLLDIERPYVLPYTGTGLFAIFLLVAVRRHVRALREAAEAREVLAQRLRAREAELEVQNARLRAIERERVIAQERERLMQDMHDGLGSSLMGALRAAEHGQLDDVPRVLRECIEDLKLAIDSLEPVQAELLPLLGALRFRLGARLQAAGITLRWDVDDVPPLPWLDPGSALHVLRILQEVLGNAVRHSGARAVAVSTRLDGSEVLVVVADDGRGFDAAQAHGPGRGLGNIRRRAAAIGAQARWLPADPGTRFELRLPLQGPRPDAPTAAPRPAVPAGTATA